MKSRWWKKSIKQLFFYKKQIYIDKEEIPVRGGECVLCYFSSHLNCIIGMSEPFKVGYLSVCYHPQDRNGSTVWPRWPLFQVHESKVAIEEGLMPEKLSEFDRAGQVRNWWGSAPGYWSLTTTAAVVMNSPPKASQSRKRLSLRV